MKKIIYFISIIVISATAITGCSREQESQSQNTDQTDAQTSTEAQAVEGDEVVPEENLVIIENNEFVPRTITIKKGTTVTWVNKDVVEHWPISDPHPTHTDLPDFNSKKAMLQNDSYQFMFESTGEFNYHDKLNTAITGTVIIE